MSDEATNREGDRPINDAAGDLGTSGDGALGDGPAESTTIDTRAPDPDITPLSENEVPEVKQAYRVPGCPFGACDGDGGLVAVSVTGETLAECKNRTCPHGNGVCVLTGDPALHAMQLDRVSATDSDQMTGGKGSQAMDLVDMVATLGVILFHTALGRAYASVREGEGFRVLDVSGDKFKFWLRKVYREARRRNVSKNALEEAVNEIEANALLVGEEAEAFLRTANKGEDVILDLGSGASFVRVGPGAGSSGWDTLSVPPVYFRQTKTMLEVPAPVRGAVPGDGLALLQNHLRMSNEDFVLTLSFLVQALRPTGPYPLLVLVGEQGTGKSTTTRMLRSLVDPHKPAIRAASKSERDLAVAANNAHLLAFDNMSHLSDALSDAYCRVSTGGGFGTRMLYQGREEEVFDFQRPMILNGIEAVVTRPDLADRSLQVELLPIPAKQRKTEAEILAAFESDRPAILGGLLDALAAALRDESAVKLASLPRMADFAKASTAASGVYPKGLPTFAKAYDANQKAAVSRTIQSNPVAEAILAMMQDPNREDRLKRRHTLGSVSSSRLTKRKPGAPNVWEGTMLQLIDDLKLYLPGTGAPPRDFPNSPRKMSAELARIAPALRTLGIKHEKPPRKATGRVHRLVMEDGP